MTQSHPLADRERATYRTVLAVLALALLVVLYLAWPVSDSPNRWEALGWNLIPNAIVAVVAIPIAYLFLAHSVGAARRKDEDLLLAKAVVDEFGSRKSLPVGVTEFHPTFRSLDWRAKLNTATTSVDLVVYYFDSWVNSNFDALRDFLQRPKTRLRVFLADPDEETVRQELARIFPENSLNVTLDKVKRTGERLGRALAEAGLHGGSLQVHFVSHVLGYSAQCFDARYLVLSFFEMYREGRIGSPAFVVDLQQAPQVAAWWAKELAGLEKDSRSG